MASNYNHEEESFHKAIGFTDEEFEAFREKQKQFIKDSLKKDGEKAYKHSHVTEEIEHTFTKKEILFLAFLQIENTKNRVEEMTKIRHILKGDPSELLKKIIPINPDDLKGKDSSDFDIDTKFKTDNNSEK